MTFLLVHRNGISEPLVVEYADRQGAEDTALHLAKTQGGHTAVYAAFELVSYYRRAELAAGVPPFGPPDFDRKLEAEEYLRDAAAADVHSSDVEPRS